MVSAAVILALYLVAWLAEPLAPQLPDTVNPRLAFAPPQAIHLFEDTPEGRRFNPHVKGLRSQVDRATLRRTFVVNEADIVPVRFFVLGPEYRLWGLVPMRLRLFGPVDATRPVFFWGADRMGRDMLSRVVYGTRVSLSVGLLGVTMSLALGLMLGGISGYFGGRTDTVIQRVIEIILSIPTIPLWMGMAAAVPATWSPLQVYFVVTIIISLISWAALGREVRGRLLALRGEEFVTAAWLDGCGELRIILRHIMPLLMSHIIASATLAIPAMIIAETALSFLGIGLRAPVISWGVLLQEAQNIQAVAQAPWLLLGPSAGIVGAILAFNFLGDGLRDAADPYG
jgi:peptide/nickel transport system permease protein